MQKKVMFMIDNIHYAGQNSHKDNANGTNTNNTHYLQENVINSNMLMPKEMNKEDITNFHFNTDSINTNTLHRIPITQLLTSNQQKTPQHTMMTNKIIQLKIQ